MAHSLLQGAAFFAGMSAAVDRAARKAVEKSAVIVEEEAKRVIGSYDYGWTPLAASTLAHKAADTPLLETGAMRASLQYSTASHRDFWEAFVGSNDPKALFQELGTVHIPPRSFLAGASMRKEHEVHKICGHDLFHSISHPEKD
jgi:hypothetical protein